jgi:hypothetical protein
VTKKKVFINSKLIVIITKPFLFAADSGTKKIGRLSYLIFVRKYGQTPLLISQER